MFSDSSAFEGDDTCSFETVLLREGDSIDSNGKKVYLTSDDVRQSFASLMKRENHSIPYYAVHDGDDVARLLKYKFVVEDDKAKILAKGVVHNPRNYYEHYDRGFIHTSPELTLHTDETGKIIHVDIDGAAMTKTPGMNPESVITKRMNFSLEKDEVTETTPDETFDWKVPLSNLESKLDDIKSSLAGFKEEQKVTTEPEKTPDINDMIQAAVEAELAKRQEQQKTIETPKEQPAVEPPIIDEKTANVLSPDIIKKIGDMAAELEATKQENKKFKEEQEKKEKQDYTDILQKCRDLGVEKPELLVAKTNLSTADKTAMLGAFAAEFVKKTQLNTPQTERISGEDTSRPTEDITIDTIMKDIGGSSKELKKLLLDCDLFDTNGNFIGYA